MVAANMGTCVTHTTGTRGGHSYACHTNGSSVASAHFEDRTDMQDRNVPSLSSLPPGDTIFCVLPRGKICICIYAKITCRRCAWAVLYIRACVMRHNYYA
jgi:hypothetical protein